MLNVVNVQCQNLFKKNKKMNVKFIIISLISTYFTLTLFYNIYLFYTNVENQKSYLTSFMNKTLENKLVTTSSYSQLDNELKSIGLIGFSIAIKDNNNSYINDDVINKPLVGTVEFKFSNPPIHEYNIVFKKQLPPIQFAIDTITSSIKKST